MNKKSLLASGVAVVLAMALTVGGTLAYLTGDTESVENTFTPNQNSVDLKETTGDEYDIIPGTSQDKDPEVTVTYTVDTYVYLVVTDKTQELVEYYIEQGWEPLLDSDGKQVTTEDGDLVYYQKVTAENADGQDEDGNYYKTLQVLEGDKVYYPEDLTNADIDAADEVSLTFQAVIIQAEPFDNAYSAWLMLNDLGVWMNMRTGHVYPADTLVEDVIPEAESGDTLTLLIENSYVSKQIYLTEKDITINLDGGILTDSYKATDDAVVVDSCVLTLENGEFTFVKGIHVSGEDAGLTLENVTVNADTSSTLDYGVYAVNGTITIDADSTLYGDKNALAIMPASDDDCVVVNIYGTVATRTVNYMSINGNVTDKGSCEINIYEGAQVGTSALSGGIYMSIPNSVINIYGGTVYGYCGICFSNGVLNLYDGEILGVGNDTELADSYGAPVNAAYDGSAIVVFPFNGGATVNLYGGKVESTYSYAVRFCKRSNQPNGMGVVNVYEGVTLSGKLGDYYLPSAYSSTLTYNLISSNG